MPEPSFKLPVSSFEELCKVIKGYAHLGDKVTLNELAKIVGMGRTTVSGNNAFLAATNLISGGKTKTSTELGTRLGRALDLGMPEETKSAWREVVQGTEFLSNLIASTRIKGPMDDDTFVSHVLYASGNPNKGTAKTGARTTLELLLASGLLVRDANEKIVVSAPEEPRGKAEPPKEPPVEDAGHIQTPREPAALRSDFPYSNNVPAVSINIQLQLPETENPKIYENLFKALRQHLLSPDE